MNKVLLIEDELAYREVLADTIRETGIIVLEAENGKEALEILQKQTADLILLDMLMPVMDGPTFLSHLLKGPKKNTPVLVLTNLSNPDIPRGIPFVMKVNTNLDTLMKIIEENLKASK